MRRIGILSSAPSHDQGRSESMPGFPARWTKRWIESLTESDFLLAARALQEEDDYWSALNLNTLHKRRMLVFRERQRRYG